MSKITVKGIIEGSVVSGFTIAAALIWKEVIMESIEMVVPSGEQLFYKIIAAIVATIIVIVGIFLVLKTESRAEKLIKRFNKK